MDRENNYKLELKDLSEDTTVTHAPTTNTITLQAPVGEIWEVVDMAYNAPAPAGSSAGTHQLYGRYTDAVSTSFIFKIISNFGATILMFRNGFQGDVSESPSASADQYKIMRDGIIIVSNAVTFDFEYTNSTDADQVGNRKLTLLVKVRREAI